MLIGNHKKSWFHEKKDTFSNTFFSSVLQRMTIVGVILSFKQLIDESLNTQLDERIPFLYRYVIYYHIFFLNHVLYSIMHCIRKILKKVKDSASLKQF